MPASLPFDDTLAALAHGSVAFDDEPLGLVVVRGRDARQFLHRLSTQHVGDSVPVCGALNTFLDKKGRVRFLAHHVTLADDTVLLVTGAGEGKALADWLESFHFSEDLTIDDVTAERRVTRVAGHGALDAVDTLVEGVRALVLFDARATPGVVVIRTFDVRVAADATLPCVLVVEETAHQSALAIAIGDALALESARIAALVPQVGHEVTDAVNPLELGLTRAIHWDKGCYTGQEVISRTENRGKQARYLVGLVSDDDLSVGDVVTHGTETLGTVTSVAPRPLAGLPRALAILRTREDLDGASVDVEGSHGKRGARVVRATQ